MEPGAKVPCLPPRFVFLLTGFVAFSAGLFFALLAGSEPPMALRDAMLGGLAVAWIAKGIAASLNQAFAQAAHDAQEAERKQKAAAENES